MSRRTGLIVAVIVLAVGACGTGPPATAGDVRMSVARAPATVPAADAAALAAGNATFAGRILGLLSRSQATVALSPFSISEAMAMVDAGAKGETAAQIDAALDFRLAPAPLGAAFNALDLSLGAIDSPGARLEIADALYGQRGMRFREAFLSALARDYGAGIRTVDFQHAAAAAVAAINAWVSRETDARIPSLLGAGDVGPSTRLVLVNAIALDARWKSPFEHADTAPAPFHAPGQTLEVPTMNQTGMFGYRRQSGYSVLELPYVGGRLAFDVLLPAPGRLAALLGTLRDGGLTAAVDGLTERELLVSLPKLRLRTRFELAGALSTLGMPIAFGSDADLSGIAGAPGALAISHVVHEAYLDVDEAGTKAAAATAVGIAPTAVRAPPALHFRVDRPFVFVLRDTSTGAVLFAGVVSRPEGESADP